MLSQSIVDELNTLFVAELLRTTTKRQSQKWECMLFEIIISEYLVTPLTSVKMLKSEGYLMNNCCREYASQCENLE